jgi:ABC-type histidine transport system ATPase subunit
MFEGETYTALIVRWLRGANAGQFGPLYISSRGKGTSLFMRGLTLYHTPKRGRQAESDIRVAVIQDSTLRILTAYDALGLEKIATSLGIKVAANTPLEFRADGTIKNGVIKVHDE